MAIRELPGRRKPFQVYYDNPFTKRRTSASFATRMEAEKADALIKYRLKYERESFKPDNEEEVRQKRKADDSMPDDSLEAIDLAYIQEKKPAFNVLSWHMEGMRIPLQMYARKRIGTITRQDIARVYEEHKLRNVKTTTVYNRMKVFFILLRWALKRGYVDTLPQFPEVEHGEYEHFVPPTQEEARRIYDAAPEHIQRIIVLGSKLGIRVGPSEMFKLRWENIDWNKGTIRVEAALKNKHEPWREIPIKESLLPEFRRWWANDQIKGIPWIISYNGRKITTFLKTWHEVVKRAGITRRIRPYDLRHAFATDAIAGGADVGTVAHLMGHSDVTMVLKHYQHVLTKQKREAVEALPDITNVTTKNVTKGNVIPMKVSRCCN